MKHPRTVALVAVAFLLYIMASAGALGVSLSTGVVALSLVSLWSALTPFWQSSQPTDEAQRLVALMGSAVALCLGAWLALSARALVGELLLALTLPPLGLITLRLALAWPDVPPRLARHLYAEYPARWLGALAALLGVFAALPPIWLFGRVLIAAPWTASAPLAFALACIVVATGVRIARRRLGSSTRALSANLWPLLGSVWALLLLAAGALGSLLGWADASTLRLFAAGAAFIFLLSHVWLISPTRALGASAWARELFATAVSLTLVLVGAYLLRLQQPVATAQVLVTLGGVGGFLLVRPIMRRLSQLLFAPQRGALLAAIERIEREIPGANSYPELAARALRLLRRASDSPEAAPLMFSFGPASEVRLDAAGQPRRSERGLPGVIMRHLSEAGGEPIVRDDLRARLVRRPELRELIQALDGLDALCVVPLLIESDLVGALLVARGARGEPLSMEELTALQRLAHALAPLSAQFLAAERALKRADETAFERDALRTSLEEARDELTRLQAEANLLKAGQATGPAASAQVQYSPAMRALNERLLSLASQDVPVLLVCEQGVPLLPLAQQLRAAAGRDDRPLVVGDCGGLSPEEQAAALFGASHGASREPGAAVGPMTPRPGWLELSADGVLLLFDVVALAPEIQRELARALADKRARRADSQAAYPISARLLLSARKPLSALLASNAIVPELARWLEQTALRVPALRERREDLESLVLLAMDRAARVLGCDVPGIAPDALSALAEYDFPGNQAELESIMERALSACRGGRITLEELPPLPAGARGVGSFVDQEREILRRAMERAGGNKTRAARALGLKRTTLIDKLRRLGLEAPGPHGTEH